jgi:hypothetical protein
VNRASGPVRAFFFGKASRPACKARKMCHAGRPYLPKKSSEAKRRQYVSHLRDLRFNWRGRFLRYERSGKWQEGAESVRLVKNRPEARR